MHSKTFEKIIKILLIEDNRADADLLKHSIGKQRRQEFELVHVRLLQDGINYLQQNCVDVILLDLSLPDSWGLESLGSIQQITAEIPIIVLTGVDDEEHALAALRAGAQDYIVKGKILLDDLLLRAINYAIERKQIVEKLRQSEARYRGVVEDQTELICRFLPDGTLTFVNEAYCRYFDQTPEQILGQNIRLAIAFDDWKLFKAHLASLSRERPTDTLEFRILPPDGEIHWQQWQNRAIFYSDGEVEYQAVGRDITERKQAEREKARLIASLHESEERFRTLANTAPVLMWMTDADGRCTFFNQSWLEFTGSSLGEELVNGWISKVHPQEQQQCWQEYKTALKRRRRFQKECRLWHHDGKYHWVINTGVPRFTSSGKFAGFICSCIDITERKQAEEKLAQQAGRDRLMAEITQHIHESLELDEILSTAVKEINQFLQAERILIAKVSSRQKLRILFESVTAEVIDHSQPTNYNREFIPGLQQSFEQLQQGKVVTSDQAAIPNGSFLHVPIIREKKLWGLLCAQHSAQPRQWKSEEIELLQQIAVQLAIAIHQSELYQKLEDANRELEQLAVIDGLTGIANRRKFDEYLASEWLRLAREQSPLSLILCDIDFFKLYNDTYGHQAGDRCLQQVAQVINQAVKRPADLAARYGGEELGVILPNTTPEGAEKVAQRIRLAVKSLHIPHVNSPVDTYVTISVGVTGCVPCHDSVPQAMIKAADHALYTAKEKGRDRVVRYQQLEANCRFEPEDCMSRLYG